uniref:C-reactive protein 1.1-like n=1 Tax=Saccoglossus kowalevskii TaxID=10224 RepID=A0ABM0MT45_SACKO|nr:PREDICTED: C-reactive protein 1.1-like [Saccoglossus kowalevskii]
MKYLLFYITSCLCVFRVLAITVENQKLVTKRNPSNALLDFYKQSDVAITTPIPELTEFTACVWINSIDNKVALFSYAISDTELNEILAWNLISPKLDIKDERFGVSQTVVNDGKCHHLCFTWTSSTGRWEIYIDGNLDDWGYKGQGRTIKGNGVLVLGQRQNLLRGRYIAGRAFVGWMTKFNLWKIVLSTSQINDVMNDDSNTLVGDVYAWDLNTLDIKGTVEVKHIDICSGGAVRCDPHFTTLDGRHYSHQGICWYTLVKDCSSVNPDFEITAKFEPRQNSTNEEFKTRVVAINITVGDEYVHVNGLDVVTGNTKGLSFGPTIINVTQIHRKVIMSFTLKDTVFKLDWTLRKHIFNVHIFGSNYRGNLCGLLGNYNDNIRDDFHKPDGTIADNAFEFGESWKIQDIECN